MNQWQHGSAFKPGFSLIECLLALALFAVLTTLSLPLQTDMGRRIQRAQARTALLQASWWMERQAAVTGSYPSALPMIAWAADGLSYNLTLSVYSGGYVLRATPAGRQTADPCGVLWLNGQGQHGADLDQETCW